MKRLRHLQCDLEEAALHTAVAGLDEACKALDAARIDQQGAVAGWQEHVAGQDVNPELLRAWQGRIARTETIVMQAALCVREAEALLAERRKSWLTAKQRLDLARIGHRGVLRIAVTAREERRLLDITDLVSVRIGKQL